MAVVLALAGYSVAPTPAAAGVDVEARGEPDEGKIAVGHVVMNRASHPLFPDKVCEVVQQGGEKLRFRCQFTWWCDGHSDQPREWRAWEKSTNPTFPSAYAYGRSAPSSPTPTSDSGSMIPTVRTDSRKLSPSTQNYDTDSRPLLEPPALALASTARSRQEDVVFDNSRQPNFCSWLQADIQSPKIDFCFTPNNGHSA